MRAPVPEQTDRAALIALALISTLMQIPFLNRGISFYDEGSILAIADGLHHGEVLYRDRVTPLAPLTYELLRALFDLFGPSLLVGRNLQAAVFTLSTLLMFWILREFMESRAALFGALALLPVKTLAFPFWTVVNYSQIAMVFCLVSVLMVLRFVAAHRLRWLCAAGLGIGMTLVTKQNLGLFLGATLSAIVALDAVREPRAVGRLVARAAALLAGSLLPVVAVVALYARAGALDALVARAVLGLLYLAQPYAIPLPVRYGPADIGDVIFAYFPTPLAQMAWEGRLNIFFSPAVYLSLAHAVQVVYFTPVAAFTLAVIALGRGLISGVPRPLWSRLLVVTAFAAMAYASMLYRADWTHLMNIAPPLLILCAVVVHRWVGESRARRWLAASAWVTWCLVGCLVAIPIFAVYRVPVETRRGTLFAPVAEAENAQRLLSYLDAQPADARILFMRSEPLFSFISERRIPGTFDLIMPGLLGAGDDAEISRQLGAVDQVVYNPKFMPTVPSPITEYAPQTAHTLATRFQAVDAISPTAIVLKRTSNASLEATATLDLWSELSHVEIQPVHPSRPSAGGEGPVITRTNWMMYRVLTAAVSEHRRHACLAVKHTVAAGESIAAIPMLNPATWASTERDLEFKREATGAVFTITAGSPSGDTETLFEERREPRVPGKELYLPLDRFVGQPIEIEFCTSLPPDAGAAAVAPAGWAEPRIVQATTSR